MTMHADYSHLNGARKAAILLTVLGEDSAASVFRTLSEGDLQQVAAEVSTLGTIPPEVSLKVLEEYQKMTIAQNFITQGGHDLARRLLVKAFGEVTAENILLRLTKASELSGNRVESLQRADPQQLARFLEGEHPQTVALILGHLGDKQGAALLMNLPEAVRAEAVKRLANLKRFSPEMAEKVSSMLNLRLKSAGDRGKRTYSGFQGVADLMNGIDALAAREILSAIEREEPALAISIRDLMFTFDDFLEVAETAIREVAGGVDKKVLAIALKGTNEELRNHFFRTMSSRAVEMLKEDIESLGPIRSKDVVQAQTEIVAIARKLEGEGKIVLKGEANDEYVV